MILFRACPRCGGDIDATYQEDVYCVQCSHRPAMTYPGPRIAGKAVEGSEASDRGPTSGTTPDDLKGQPPEESEAHSCPRCDSRELVRMDKLRQRDNTCYRCRMCGHIFSPAPGDVERRDRVAPKRVR